MTRLGDTTADNPGITAKTADFQLSQEETGFSLIIQDVSKDNEHVVEFNLEKVCFTNLWWKKPLTSSWGSVNSYLKTLTPSGDEQGDYIHTIYKHVYEAYVQLKVSNYVRFMPCVTA